MATVDLRALALFHVTRFVGFYFLVLHARGELPWAFAVPGGWGDNITAAWVLVLVTFVGPDTSGGRATSRGTSSGSSTSSESC